MITFNHPEWLDEPGDVRLHAAVLLDAEAVNSSALPCPFCGGAHMTISNTHTPCFTVECETCGCVVSGKAVYPRAGRYTSRKAALNGYRKAFKSALEVWNKRAQPRHLDFNINHDVLVRLTDRGHRALRQIGYRAMPLTSPEGLSRWQLWNLMNVFGPHIGPCHGDTPFETTITLCLPSKP